LKLKSENSTGVDKGSQKIEQEQYEVGHRDRANSNQVVSANRHQQLVDETTNKHESDRSGLLRTVDGMISQDFEQMSQHETLIYQ